MGGVSPDMAVCLAGIHYRFSKFSTRFDFSHNTKPNGVLNWKKITPRLMTVDQAAFYIGISPRTLRNRICRKAENPMPFKAKRMGRKVLFDRKDKLHLQTLCSGCDE